MSINNWSTRLKQREELLTRISSSTEAVLADKLFFVRKKQGHICEEDLCVRRPHSRNSKEEIRWAHEVSNRSKGGWSKLRMFHISVINVNNIIVSISSKGTKHLLQQFFCKHLGIKLHHIIFSSVSQIGSRVLFSMSA